MTTLDAPLPSLEHYLADSDDTLRVGQALARAASSGGILFLQGTLGAGKTTFSRGLIQALGHSGSVKSPTYTLVEPYESLSPPVFHFDLYRLGEPEELEYMGIRDFLQPSALALIEWPSRGEGYLPPADVIIDIQLAAPGRQLTAMAHTPRGKTLLSEWSDSLGQPISASEPQASRCDS